MNAFKAAYRIVVCIGVNQEMAREAIVSECSPEAAWEAVQADDKAHIIDVRTVPEWAHVGAPELGDKSYKLHFVSWQLAPDMRINPDFLTELAAEDIPDDAKLYFLCRSGVRSLAAAGLACMALEAGRTLVLDRDEVVAAADAAGIAVFGYAGDDDD